MTREEIINAIAFIHCRHEPKKIVGRQVFSCKQHYEEVESIIDDTEGIDPSLIEITARSFDSHMYKTRKRLTGLELDDALHVLLTVVPVVLQNYKEKENGDLY